MLCGRWHSRLYNFMKISIRKTLLLLLSLLIAVPSITHGEKTTPYQQKQKIIYGDGSPGPYSIGQRFIGGTVSVDISSTEFSIQKTAENPPGTKILKSSIQNSDSLYVIDWDDLEGTVTLNRPLVEGDSVAVTYAVPPLWIRDIYRRSKSEKTYGTGLNTSYQAYRK